MHRVWIFVLPMLAVGCATHRSVSVQAPPRPLLPVVSPTKLMETRYDVRGYREAADPTLRHEAHAVFRQTRVPLGADESLETVPRNEVAPISLTPLPASAELSAELATQKGITANLRAVQAEVAETETQVQAQYAALIRQSADALRLREQLERERAMLQTASPPSAPPASADASTPNPSAVKW